MSGDHNQYQKPELKPEPEVGVCCQEFDKCLRSCTPRGQWIAHKAAQREWQGLTEYEVGFLTVFDGLHDVEVPLLANFIRHIEAKLKEKNT